MFQSIHKFISDLSPRGKIVFSLTVLVVAVALFDRLAYGPFTSKLQKIDESIAKEEKTIQNNIHFLSYRDRVVKEASAFKEFYVKDVRAEEEVIADFLKKIELIASQSQVELSKITPAGQDYQKEYLKYFVTLDCAGKYADITSFIYAVNNSTELLKVEKMNIVGNARDAEKVVANLTISKMIVGADPSVEAKALIKAKAASVEAPATETPKK